MPNCFSADIALQYLGKIICERCWEKHAENPEAIRKKLNIRQKKK